MSEQRLNGLRVLVVEDETLVAIFLEDMLKELACEVVCLAPRLDDARNIMDRQKIDCAILDVNVAGEMIYPLAQELADRGVPFLFVTGYSKLSKLPEFDDRPILQKPFRMAELRDLLIDLTQSRSARGRVPQH